MEPWLKQKQLDIKNLKETGQFIKLSVSTGIIV